MKKSFTLQELARVLEAELTAPEDGKVLVESLTISSKLSHSRGLFVAIKGEKVDGHEFIGEAAKQGVCAFVGTKKGNHSLPGILVKDTRVALSKLAAIFFGNPSRNLELIAVTGTNGKTTLCSLLYNLFLELGLRPIRLGTLGVKAEGIIDEAGNLTTPDPLTLNTYLSHALSQGVNCGAMEVSSHGLSQHRVDDIEFNVGIYTNLTRDHLDYHENMESYYRAKLRLFKLMAERGSGGTAVINVDCAYGQRIIGDMSGANLRFLTYGKSESADVRISDFSQTVEGSKFRICHAGLDRGVKVPFIGFHNALNLSAACAAMLALGHDIDSVVNVLPNLPQVPGRLEAVQGAKVPVFVDYAHTPDALENVLSALKPLVKSKLWLVFGCGGDRDRGKRAEMGRVASVYADKIVVTSDNPRTEDPQSIIREIVAGVSGKCYTEVDRRKAIEIAVSQAGSEDLVLIAGKGHENYQIIGTERVPFSDVDEVRKALL